MADVGGVSGVGAKAPIGATDGVVGQGGVQDAAKARASAGPETTSAIHDYAMAAWHAGATIGNFLQAGGNGIGALLNEAIGRPEAAASYTEAGKAASSRQNANEMMSGAYWTSARMKTQR